MAGQLEGQIALTNEVTAPIAGNDSSERTRLEKELAQAEARLESVRARLADPAFTGRAPAAVVEGARRSELDLAAQAASLREKLGLS